MSQPDVSVILPTFNARGFVEPAVQSVRDQTFDNWELIVVDDGSDDGTRDFFSSLQDERVRYLERPHTGLPSVVRNQAVAQASGHYLAFLDSDDLWKPGKLRTQLEGLRSHEDARWSYTDFERMDRQGRPRNEPFVRAWKEYSGYILDQLICIDAIVATPTVMLEKSLFDEAGGFNEDLRYCEDYDLWLRIAPGNAVIAIPEKLSVVRSSYESHSGNRLEVYKAWVEVYDSHARQLEGRQRKSCCRQAAKNRVEVALHEIRLGHRAAAFRRLAGALRSMWRHGQYWRALFRAALPAAIIQRRKRQGEVQ